MNSEELLASIMEGNSPDKTKELKISSKKLGSLCDLSAFTLLQKLYINDNELTSLEGIENNTELTMLVADTNKLSDIHPYVDNLTKLKILNIGSNQFTKINNLSCLKSLCVLIAGTNQLTELPNFEGLESLNTIILSNNQLTKISFTYFPPKLRKLTLSHNQIKEIPDLSEFQELVELRLNFNLIETVPESLSSLKKLSIIELGENKISSIDNMKILLTMTQLTNIGLKNNPLTEDYAEQMQSSLPALKVLDGQRVKPKKSHYSEDHPKYQMKRELVQKIVAEQKKEQRKKDKQEIREKVIASGRDFHRKPKHVADAEHKAAREAKKNMIRKHRHNGEANETNENENPE